MPARLSSASSSSRCRVWQCSPRSAPPRSTGSTELRTGPRRAPAHPSGPTLSPSSPLVNVGKKTTMHRTKGPKIYIMCQIDIGEWYFFLILNNSFRILGGLDVNHHKYPWQALIHNIFRNFNKITSQLLLSNTV